MEFIQAQIKMFVLYLVASYHADNANLDILVQLLIAYRK